MINDTGERRFSIGAVDVVDAATLQTADLFPYRLFSPDGGDA